MPCCTRPYVVINMPASGHGRATEPGSPARLGRTFLAVVTSGCPEVRPVTAAAVARRQCPDLENVRIPSLHHRQGRLPWAREDLAMPYEFRILAADDDAELARLIADARTAITGGGSWGRFVEVRMAAGRQPVSRPVAIPASKSPSAGALSTPSSGPARSTPRSSALTGSLISSTEAGCQPCRRLRRKSAVARDNGGRGTRDEVFIISKQFPDSGQAARARPGRPGCRQ